MSNLFKAKHKQTGKIYTVTALHSPDNSGNFKLGTLIDETGKITHNASMEDYVIYPAAFQEYGSQGGKATKQKHGPDYFKKIGQLGGMKKKGRKAEDRIHELVSKKKALEAENLSLKKKIEELSKLKS